MELYDWLLALHVIAAFGMVAGIVAIWALVLATGRQILGPEETQRYGGIAGPMIGVTATVTLLLGIGLVLEVEAYELFDFWIIAAIVLWIVAMALGPMGDKAFASGPSGRGRGITLLAVNSIVTLAILILMIWKPGA